MKKLLYQSLVLLTFFATSLFVSCDDDSTEDLYVDTEEEIIKTTLEVVGDNLTDEVVMLDDERIYSVELSLSDVADSTLESAIRWYLDGEQVASGESYTVIFDEVGEVSVKYTFSLESDLYEGEEASNEATVTVMQPVADEDKVSVVRDNLYYHEMQINTSKSYFVTLDKELIDDEAVVWSINDIEVATGVSFDYVPTMEGVAEVKYTISQYYTTSGVEESDSVDFVAYSSDGVYILNEPNMTAEESIRGVNKYIFGSDTVTRHIVGDYTTFGTTNQYITTWDSDLYVVASYPMSGVSLSKFEAETGEFIAAIDEFPGCSSYGVRAFEGVNYEMGVVTTAYGAYIINLADMSYDDDDTLFESYDSKNLCVADGYLFMIVGSTLQAYPIDSLSTTTEPIVLGSATCGFTRSKDGQLWAANGNTLVAINTEDLTISERSIPDGVSVVYSTSPWKQVALVASTEENLLFFNKESWGMGSSVYKYNIDTEELQAEFVVRDQLESHYLYATSLYYDSANNNLLCQTIKGYGTSSAYNGIFSFNATTGVNVSSVLYDTSEADLYGSKDMWYPAMMTAIKNY